MRHGRDNLDYWPPIYATINNAPEFDEAVMWKGKGSAKCRSGQTDYLQIAFTAWTDRTFYYRVAVRTPEAFPSEAREIIRLSDATGTFLGISLGSTSQKNFRSWVAAANPAAAIGANSAEVSLNTWYVIEIKCKVNSVNEGNATLAWKVLKSNGEVFLAEQTASLKQATARNTGVKYLRAGWLQSGAVAGLHIDAMAVQDEQYSTDNSWVGTNYTEPAAQPTATRCYYGATMDGDVGILEGTGERGDAPYNDETWNLFETHAGRANGVTTISHSNWTWDSYGAGATKKIIERSPGQIPCITLTSPGTITEINEGKKDAAIEAWAEKAKAFEYPIWARPFWEFNGTWWENWGRQYGATAFIEAWKRIVDKVKAKGATNVSWMWCINHIEESAWDPEPWYPGDEYVDWTSIDAYSGTQAKKNVGWNAPFRLFKYSYDRLREIAPSKPIFIAETAASETGGTKSTWIEELLGGLEGNFPQIKGITWFNDYIEHEGERITWPIESSEAAKAAYKAEAADTYFVTKNVTELTKNQKVPEPSAPAGKEAVELIPTAAAIQTTAGTATAKVATKLTPTAAAIQTTAVGQISVPAGKEPVTLTPTAAAIQTSAGTATAKVRVKLTSTAAAIQTSATAQISVPAGKEPVALTPTKAVIQTSAAASISVPSPSTGIVVRLEPPPDQLAIRLVTPNGTPHRWAGDEPLPQDVASAIEISDEMPGGYKEMSCTLARDPRGTWPDLSAYSDLQVDQPGGEPVFEGFLDKTPRASGDQVAVTPAALGHQAVLEDNSDVRTGFLHQDMSAWQGMTPLRQRTLLEGGWTVGDAATGATPSGSPALQFEQNSPWSTAKTIVQATFDAGPKIRIKKIYWWRSSGSNSGIISDPTSVWLFQCLIGSDENFVTSESSSDFHTADRDSDAAGTSFDASVARRWGAFVWKWESGSKENSYSWSSYVRGITVIADHELPVYGKHPELYMRTCDMLPYLIEQFGAPLTVDPEYIDDDGYENPHAWYQDSQTLGEIIKDLVKFAAFDWFVYHKKRFEYRRPGSYGRVWKAYVGESGLNELGEDSQRLWRDVVVQYQDVDGSTRTVGPFGSGCDVESAACEITDPSHPAVAAERTRRDILDLRGIGTPALCENVAERFLREANELQHSGSASLSGYVLETTGILRPAAQVKSGDWIEFVDSLDRTPRKIINKRYSDDDKTAQIDVDAPSGGLEELLERLQAALIPLGVA
jgi:mannan endo-1,4-beta-mannosidase